MTTYVTIANTEVDPDSPITADLITKLRDNPLAIGEGAAGAPKITAAALNTSTSTLTGTVSASSTLTVALGAYAFFPSVNWGAGGSASLSTVGTTADNGGIALVNGSGSSIAYTIRWRKIT